MDFNHGDIGDSDSWAAYQSCYNREEARVAQLLISLEKLSRGTNIEIKFSSRKINKWSILK